MGRRCSTPKFKTMTHDSSKAPQFPGDGLKPYKKKKCTSTNKIKSTISVSLLISMFQLPPTHTTRPVRYHFITLAHSLITSAKIDVFGAQVHRQHAVHHTRRAQLSREYHLSVCAMGSSRPRLEQHVGMCGGLQGINARRWREVHSDRQSPSRPGKASGARTCSTQPEISSRAYSAVLYLQKRRDQRFIGNDIPLLTERVNTKTGLSGVIRSKTRYQARDWEGLRA